MLSTSALWVLVPSAIATAFCWRRIWRTPEPMFLRVVSSVVAAVPVLGPIFYLLGQMPPRHPMHYPHSHGTFFGELSVEKLMSLLSKARRSNERSKDR